MSPGEARQRKYADKNISSGSVERKAGAESQAKQTGKGFGILDVFRILAGLFMLNCLLSYFVTNDSVLWGWRPWFVRPQVVLRYLQGPVSLTDAELAEYDGTDPKLPIYLALNGTIYDVSAAHRVYGPGGSYHAFAGRDAARAFITGCFAEDGTPDVRGAEWTFVPTDVPGPEAESVKLTGTQKTYREQELRKARKQVHATIEGWQKLFRGENGKDYFEVGKVRREEGWLEKLPRRKLCAQAQKARPKPKAEAKDAGAAYRGERKV